MESLKPILLLIVLAGVGYAVYVALNHAPPSEPPPASLPWKKPPGDAATSVKPATNPASVESSPDSSRDRATATSVTGSPTSTPGISLPFGIGSSAVQSNSGPSPAQNEYSSGPSTIRSPGDAPAMSPSAASATVSARYEFESAMRRGETLARQGKLLDALRELSPWCDSSAVPPEQQSQLMNLVGQLAGTVIYSKQHWLAAAYVVQQGDTLESIAQQCDVPWQILAKINGIGDPSSLAIGEELKVVHGPFTAKLNLQQDCLTVFIAGLYAGRFQVQGGRNSIKPEGNYPVAKFSADDPANVAHRPYISLGGDLQLRVPDDVAIQTAGAVVISARDMSDLFDMLSARSEVTVRR